MKIVGRCSVFLLLGLLASQSAQAVWSATSLNGYITVSDGVGPQSYEAGLGKLTGPDPYPAAGSYTNYEYDPMDPASGIGVIEGMMVSTVFAPDNSSVIARNGNHVTTAYMAVDPVNQNKPLTPMAQPSSYFQVINVRGLGGVFEGWDYTVGGVLPGIPGQPPFVDDQGDPNPIPVGALSMLFQRDQYVLQFGLNGIDVYDPRLDPVTGWPTNPTSNMYLDFYDRNGALVDQVIVNLGRTTISDPDRLLLAFQTTPSAPLFAGVTMTTDDKFGLRYGAISYGTPVPPSLPLILTGMVWLLRPRRCQ